MYKLSGTVIQYTPMLWSIGGEVCVLPPHFMRQIIVIQLIIIY